MSAEQYRLLSYLYANEGRVCSREELVAQIWPDARAEGSGRGRARLQVVPTEGTTDLVQEAEEVVDQPVARLRGIVHETVPRVEEGLDPPAGVEPPIRRVHGAKQFRASLRALDSPDRGIGVLSLPQLRSQVRGNAVPVFELEGVGIEPAAGAQTDSERHLEGDRSGDQRLSGTARAPLAVSARNELDGPAGIPLRARLLEATVPGRHGLPESHGVRRERLGARGAQHRGGVGGAESVGELHGPRKRQRGPDARQARPGGARRALGAPLQEPGSLGEPASFEHAERGVELSMMAQRVGVEGTPRAVGLGRVGGLEVEGLGDPRHDCEREREGELGRAGTGAHRHRALGAQAARQPVQEASAGMQQFVDVDLVTYWKQFHDGVEAVHDDPLAGGCSLRLDAGKRDKDDAPGPKFERAAQGPCRAALGLRVAGADGGNEEVHSRRSALLHSGRHDSTPGLVLNWLNTSLGSLSRALPVLELKEAVEHSLRD